MSPDPPIGRRRSGCGARRAEGGDEHGRERTRGCVTDRAQETTPGSAASAPEMQVRLGGFGLRLSPPGLALEGLLELLGVGGKPELRGLALVVDVVHVHGVVFVGLALAA